MSVLAIIISLLGIPVLSNGVVLLFSQASNIGVYLTIALGIVMILVGVFFKLIKTLILKPVFKLLSIVITIGLILTVFVSGFLYIYGNADTATYNEDYLVVLGCGLHGTEPSEMLRLRLDKAIEYNEKNPDCKIIVTGGQGSGEDIPEAEAMAIYLVDKGVEESKIIKEFASTSTTENFSFSNDIVKGELETKKVCFITNDFHIYRANSLAKLQNMKFTHLSAKTPLHSVIPSYLRETLALGQMILLNK